VEERSLKFVAEACAGKIRRGPPETPVLNVCTDSRHVRPGDLFFAIKGERFDGHDFLNEVIAKGAAAIVMEEKKTPGQMPDGAVLVVDDSRAAFGRLATTYRKDFNLPVVAVGGSNGKTTTKELIASVLSQKLKTLWSEASFNNDIGVPATLLRLEKSHQAAVLEAGTNHPGELAPLVRMIQPKFGVITNIGREHLEFFGDVAGVAQEEGWLAELLPVDGILFINGDNDWTEAILKRTVAPAVRVGRVESNDWYAKKIRLDKNGVTFLVNAPKPEFNGEYRINLLGRHQVTNALFAIAVGAQLGLSRDEIQSGLTECQPPKMRLQFWEANGVRVLDDAYNANADSTIAALETLCDLPLQGRRVAVLGDMGELGAHSEAAHAEVGRRAGELGIGQLFTVGKLSANTARAARDAGLSRVIEFADVEAAVRAVKNFLKPGDVVLLKASRASRLERIAETLKTEK
jgi:UDP-N-acetylmuramoyl-tripeptide--D-alanyl-D-alanine ligase